MLSTRTWVGIKTLGPGFCVSFAMKRVCSYIHTVRRTSGNNFAKASYRLLSMRHPTPTLHDLHTNLLPPTSEATCATATAEAFFAYIQ